MMLNRFHAFTIMTFSVMNEALAQATPPATSGLTSCARTCG
jgi:hypothetical protein